MIGAAKAAFLGGGTSSYRYWRVRSDDTNIAGDYMACTELEMRAVPGGSDQTTGKTATADFNAGAPYVPANAIDDNTGTFWTTGVQSLGAGHWLQVDFVTQVQVSEVSYKVRTDTFREDPNNLYVEASNDGSTWGIEWSVLGIGTWTAGETKIFTRP